MRILSILLTTLLLSASCTKDRPVQFAQGQGENLILVSELNGKEFTLIAGEQFESSSSSISSSEITAGSGYKHPLMKSFPLVHYTTKGDVLNVMDDVPFRGVPGKTYRFRYELANDIVMAYLVAKKDEIHGSLTTSAEKFEGDLFKVPYAYRSVSLLKVQNVEDFNRERTNTLGEYRANDLGEATHFRVSTTKPVLYEPENKVDVLPASLFQGEWFYAVTITKASINNSGAVGSQYDSDFDFDTASRVRFESRRDRIRAVNTNVADEVDQNDDINLISVVDFPVERLAFRVQENGTLAGKAEERIGSKDEKAPNWRDLEYLKIDFTDVKSPSTISDQKTSLHNFIIDEGFFSFDLEFPEDQIRLKFAFKKAHEPKKGLIYPKDDRKIFGFFPTIKKSINDYKLEFEVDYEKNVFLSRFYPENGIIEYHLSDLTPKLFEPAAKRAIEAWNKVFQDTGTGIQVKLADDYKTKRVAVGDIRYNIINIVKNLDSDGGGYGPQIADSASGEIISATANVRTGLFTDDTMETIRNYVKAKLGFFNEKYASFAPSWGKHVNYNSPMSLSSNFKEMSDAYDISTSSVFNYDGLAEKFRLKNSVASKTLNEYALMSQSLIRNSTKILPGGVEVMIDQSLFEGEDSDRTDKVASLINTYNKAKLAGVIPEGVNKLQFKKSNRFLNQRKGHENLTPNNKRLLLLVKRDCESEIQTYVDHLQENNITHDTERELPMLEQCHDKIINDVVFGVVLHELGHNFGLRHNFFGGTDVRNFPVGSNQKEVFGSSSIMDYLGMTMVDRPGEYDNAAIRYGYTRKAEGTDKLQGTDKVLTVENGVSIMDTFKQNSLVFEKKYKYCTDEDISNGIRVPGGFLMFVTQFDPLCQRHLFGTTPLEVVELAVLEFEAFNAVYGKRYGRANGPNQDSATRNFGARIGEPIKKIYDQWRWHFKNFLESYDPASTSKIDLIKKKTSGYLENVSKEEYNLLINAMKADTGKHGKAFAEYFEAAQKGYQFFRSLLVMPSLFCGVKKAENQVNMEMMSFYTIRTNMHRDDGHMVQSCEEANELGYFATLGVEYIESKGQYANSIKHSLDYANPDKNITDILGYEYSQFISTVFLTMRQPTTYQTIRDDFAPNYVDNPYVREEMEEIIQNQLYLGVNSSDLEVKVIADVASVTDEDIVNFAFERNPVLLQNFQQGEAAVKQSQEYITNVTPMLALINSVITYREAKAAGDEVEAPEVPAAILAQLNILEIELSEVVKARDGMQKGFEEATKVLEGATKGRADFLANTILNTKKDYLEFLSGQGRYYPFFKENGNKLIASIGIFIQAGILIPGKLDANVERIKRYETYKNPQTIASIKQGYDSRGDTDGYALIEYGTRGYMALKEENPVAYSLIKKALELRDSRTVAIEGVNDVLVDQKKLLVDVLTGLLPSMEELSSNPLEKLVELFQGKFNGVMQQITDSPGIPDEMKVELQKFAVSSFNFFRTFAGGAITPELVEQVKSEGAVSILDLMTKINGGTFTEELIKSVSADNAEAIASRYVNAISALKVRADNYNANFSELEAQRDAFSKIILALP